MRILWLGLCLAVGANCARASAAPYWVAWEGNDYPENEGWTRYNYGDGPATRTLADGIMTIDSLWSFNISDFYKVERQMNPEPGELFIAEWRMRVVEEYGHPLSTGDQGITVAGDEGNAVSFRYRVDQMISTYENWSIPIAPMEFHDFRIVASSLVGYSLFLDGLLVRPGAFEPQNTKRGVLRVWRRGKRSAIADRVGLREIRRGARAIVGNHPPRPHFCGCVFAMLSPILTQELQLAGWAESSEPRRVRPGVVSAARLNVGFLN